MILLCERSQLHYPYSPYPTVVPVAVSNEENIKTLFIKYINTKGQDGSSQAALSLHHKREYQLECQSFFQQSLQATEYYEFSTYSSPEAGLSVEDAAGLVFPSFISECTGWSEQLERTGCVCARSEDFTYPLKHLSRRECSESLSAADAVEQRNSHALLIQRSLYSQTIPLQKRSLSLLYFVFSGLSHSTVQPLTGPFILPHSQRTRK